MPKFLLMKITVDKQNRQQSKTNPELIFVIHLSKFWWLRSSKWLRTSRFKALKCIIFQQFNALNSYVLNSGITTPNLTKLLQDVQKWLKITTLKSKLRFSNPLWNANVTNEDRRQIAGESRQKLRALTAKTPRLLNGSSPNLYTMLPSYCHWIRWKRIYNRPIRCRMPKQRVRSFHVKPTVQLLMS